MAIRHSDRKRTNVNKCAHYIREEKRFWFKDKFEKNVFLFKDKLQNIFGLKIHLKVAKYFWFKDTFKRCKIFSV